MPRKKAENDQLPELSLDNPDTETDNADFIFGVREDCGAAAEDNSVCETDLEGLHLCAENNMSGSFFNQGISNPDTDIENVETRHSSAKKSSFSVGFSQIPDTDLENGSSPGGEGRLQSENHKNHDTDFNEAALPDPDGVVDLPSGENPSIPDTETEKPRRGRGRPRKQPSESEFQETAKNLPAAAAGSRINPSIMTIDGERSVQLDSDKFQQDLLDLSESLHGSRILSGTIQGIEQLEQRDSFAVIYYGNFKIIIPTEELITLPGDIGDRDPTAVRHRLLNRRLGAEIDFVIKGIDRDAGIAAASRTDAMARKQRRYFYGTDRDGYNRIYEGLCAEARVVSTIRNGIFVEFFGVESYIPLRELSYQRWHDTTEHYQNGDRILVKVLSVDRSDRNNIQIGLSVKQTGENPFDNAIKRYKKGNRYIGKTTMIIQNGVIVALDGEVDCLCRFPAYGRPPVGSRVTVLINGINMENKRIWGIILHVSPR